MTTPEALRVIDGALSGVNANRNTHLVMIEAVNHIKKELSPKPKVKEIPKKVKPGKNEK